MRLLQRIASVVLSLALAGGVAAGAWWLVTTKAAGTKTDKPAPPASVAKVIKEDELNTVVLTAEAVGRLGLKTGPVEKKAVRRVRVYGGEVTVPAGRAVVVSAPLGGMLKAPPGGLPKVGERVAKGRPLFLLLPLLTPEARTTIATSQVVADGQVNSAETQLAAAQVALDRTKGLLKKEAGSKRMVDEAQAAFDLATKSLDAAKAQRDLLVKVGGEIESGTAAPIPIESPDAGLLRNLIALPGQNVPSGAGLFEVVDLDRVWVRVPLPEGDLDEIARGDDAAVGNLTATPGAKTLPARPVAAPPTANPLAATVDVFYDLANPGGKFIPGQRVGVTLPLNDARDGPTVPWPAVVFDINGGTWVFEQTAPRTFARRRVVVRYVHGADAVLAGGPGVGAAVVVEGAQELFAAETGFK